MLNEMFSGRFPAVSLKILRRALPALLLALAASRPAAAQAEAGAAPEPLQPVETPVAEPAGQVKNSGPKITAIRIKGAQRLGKDMLAGMLPFKVGDVYDEQSVRDNFQALLKRDLFEDLKVEADEVDGGVILTYTVKELPILHDIFIENIKAMSQSAALDKLKENNLEIQTGVTIDFERIKRAEEALRQMLGGAGLQDAQVRSKLDPLTSGEVNVIFIVDEGPQTRLRDLKIIGAEFFTERQLRDALKDLKRQWVLSFISSKNKYSRGKLDQAAEKWQEMYEANGFIDYELGEPETTPAGEKYKKRKKVRFVKTRYVDLTLRLKEGPRYKLGTISYSGNELFTDAELRRQLPGHRVSRWSRHPVLKYAEWFAKPVRRILRPDKPLEGQYVNKPLMKALGKGIEGRYGNKGYIYAGANLVFKRHPPVEGAEHVKGEALIADVEYQISEDRQYRLGRIEFDGNTRTYDRTLRREFSVMEGDIFNNDLYQTGLYKIQQLALFELTANPKIEKVEGKEGLVQVKIAGKEAKHDELQVGGGYSGASGGFFNFSFATRNFRGRGHTLNASVQFGKRQKFYTLSVFNPWFMGRHIGASFSLRNSSQDYTSFSRDSRGFGVGLSKPLSAFSSVRLNYDFERVTAGNFAVIGNASTLTAGTGSASTLNNTTLSTVTASYNYDTRNDIFRANRGGLFNASLGYTGGIFGGQTNLFRPSVEASYYFSPWRKQTFAFHGTANYVGAFGGKQIPEFERILIGGEFTLRAFPLYGVLPQTSPGSFQADRNSCTSTDGTNYACTVTTRVPGTDPNAPLTPLNSSTITHFCQDSGGKILCTDTGGRYFQNPFNRAIQGGNRSFVANFEYVYHIAEPLDAAIFMDIGQTYHELQTLDFSRALVDVGIEIRFYIPAIQAPLRMFWAKNLTPRPCIAAGFCDEGTVFQFTIGQTF